MTPEERQRELEANAFAMELLMPEESIRRDVGDHDFDMEGDPKIHKLAKKYGVDTNVMIVRLAMLGFLGGEA